MAVSDSDGDESVLSVREDGAAAKAIHEWPGMVGDEDDELPLSLAMLSSLRCTEVDRKERWRLHEPSLMGDGRVR